MGRLVRSLMTPNPPAEATALLALMLLHDARRDARIDSNGDIVILEDQDRSRWNHSQIEEALALVEEAFRASPGSYALQAAIAAEHCRAATNADTNWRNIVRLYDRLEQLQPSPIVSLNRAVAVAMAEGLRPALELVNAIAATNALDNYHLLYAVRADLLRRMGSHEDAAQSYKRALELVANESERRFLQRRLEEMESSVR
jgi:RNA polymerase sigma-70 factor, ECF subfamily